MVTESTGSRNIVDWGRGSRDWAEAGKKDNRRKRAAEIL